MATIALAAILVGGCSDANSGSPGLPYDEAHADAVHRLRHQEGIFRLSGGWAARDDLAGEQLPPRFEGALPLIAELTGSRLRDSGFEGPAAAGNLLAALGMADQALPHLEAARRLAPSEARVLNDLGVALQASATSKPEAYVRALELFDSAMESDPELLPARFNLALALESLSLRWQSAREWERLLEKEPSGAWGARARSHLDRLTNQSERSSPWDPSLLAAADARGLRSQAAIHPYAVRRFLEVDLLERWTDAASAGESAEATLVLDRFRSAAESLSERTGDGLLLDVSKALRRASQSGESERAARSVAFFLEGMGHRAEDRCDLAQPLLRRAARELSTGGNPLGLLAEFYAGVCASRRTSAGEILEFSDLLDRSSLAEYPLLRARILWMLALRAGTRAEPLSSLVLRQQALAAFQAAGEREMVSVLQGMIADNLFALGRVEDSWGLRIEALRSAAGDAEVVARLLPTAAAICQRMGLPRAALRFRAEEIELARRAESPIALAAALSGRGILRLSLGQADQARDDLRQALEISERIPDESTRQYVASQASLTLATLLREAEPRVALEAVDDALRRRERSELRLLLPETYLERARILRRLGSQDTAVASLEAALEVLEETRRGLAEPELRVSYFEKSREIFDELVETEFAGRASPERLLDILARAQARGLSEGGSRGNSGSLGEQAAKYVQSLPASSLLLVYYELPEALLCLRHYRGELTAHRLAPPSPEELEALLIWLRELSMERQAPHRGASSSEWVFERLLRPVWPRDWKRGGELIVVPDGQLAQIPFSAVVNPATKRNLAMEHPVRLLPGLGVGGRSLAAEGGPWTGVLAVGDPAFDPAVAAGRSRLPGAGREAKEIVAIAPNGRSLLAHEATEKALAFHLPSFEILHLATHGTVAADPGSSYLLLAPDDGHDGVLYAHELSKLDLRGVRLVVLSACSTAKGPQDTLEGPLTLARSFLAQGVPVVVAALWPVEDDSARAFMRQFYERLWAGATASEALVGSQAWAIASGDPEMASPSTWAAFQLIGGAGRLPKEGG